MRANVSCMRRHDCTCGTMRATCELYFQQANKHTIQARGGRGLSLQIGLLSYCLISYAQRCGTGASLPNPMNSNQPSEYGVWHNRAANDQIQVLTSEESDLMPFHASHFALSFTLTLDGPACGAAPHVDCLYAA
mmetsp:Transcript_7727/g.24145  ORF Transcript_7727/g.24145 Transcript_7727/m.24145 type:complete len:134 (-) Transcript_7727:241-642(-)|eukprot:scaffold154375_cov33-Tisochrysis_lutea.AAC.3